MSRHFEGCEVESREHQVRGFRTLGDRRRNRTLVDDFRPKPAVRGSGYASPVVAISNRRHGPFLAEPAALHDVAALERVVVSEGPVAPKARLKGPGPGAWQAGRYHHRAPGAILVQRTRPGLQVRDAGLLRPRFHRAGCRRGKARRPGSAWKRRGRTQTSTNLVENLVDGTPFPTSRSTNSTRFLALPNKWADSARR